MDGRPPRVTGRLSDVDVLRDSLKDSTPAVLGESTSGSEFEDDLDGTWDEEEGRGGYDGTLDRCQASWSDSADEEGEGEDDGDGGGGGDEADPSNDGKGGGSGRSRRNDPPPPFSSGQASTADASSSSRARRPRAAAGARSLPSPAPSPARRRSSPATTEGWWSAPIRIAFVLGPSGRVVGGRAIL